MKIADNQLIGDGSKLDLKVNIPLPPPRKGGHTHEEISVNSSSV